MILNLKIGYQEQYISMEKNDLLILISSSGESKNMINAVKMAKKKKFNRIITFTGFKKNNSLKKNWKFKRLG